MREMRKESHHLVVLFYGERTYMFEAELSSQILAKFDCALRIFFGRHDDVIRAVENFRFCVLDARTFSACHRVRAYKFHVAAKHALHLFHNAALYAGNVGYHRAGLEAVLIVFNPFDECMRIKRKHD